MSRRYVVTRGGQQVFLDDPKPHNFDPFDTAWALAREPRFAGNYGDYSVAQHAVNVASAVWTLTEDPVLALAGLHHDDAESVTGDIPSPVKALCPSLQNIEAKLNTVIGIRYEVDLSAEAVKQADRRVLVSEVWVHVPAASRFLYGVSDKPSILCWDDYLPWPASVCVAKYMNLHDKFTQMREKGWTK